MSKTRRFASKLVALGQLVVFCAIIVAIVSGCSSTGTIVQAESLCTDWREISVSKRDRLTQGTASQIESNNKSRGGWGCQ